MFECRYVWVLFAVIFAECSTVRAWCDHIFLIWFICIYKYLAHFSKKGFHEKQLPLMVLLYLLELYS